MRAQGSGVPRARRVMVIGERALGGREVRWGEGMCWMERSW